MFVINRCVVCSKILFKILNKAKIVLKSSNGEQSVRYLCTNCEDEFEQLVNKLEQEEQVVEV